MNAKFEAMRAQVNQMRADKAQARKLQEQQNADSQLIYHDSVDSLMNAIRAQRKAGDENM
jgi:hypothetical protein